jgi:hypothetical protein
MRRSMWWSRDSWRVSKIHGESDWYATHWQFKETADQLQNDGVSPAGGSPEQFLATITKEIEVWRKVVSDAGIKVE